MEWDVQVNVHGDNDGVISYVQRFSVAFLDRRELWTLRDPRSAIVDSVARDLDFIRERMIDAECEGLARELGVEWPVVRLPLRDSRGRFKAAA